MSEDNPACMFVTLFVGVLDTRTATVRYCNAGHNPPFVIRTGGRVEKLDGRHGPVVGAISDVSYAEEQVSLDGGELLVAYSDGVTEAFGEGGQLYDEARLVDLLESSPPSTPKQIVEDIAQSVSVFTAGVDQSDDITILALQFVN